MGSRFAKHCLLCLALVAQGTLALICGGCGERAASLPAKGQTEDEIAAAGDFTADDPLPDGSTDVGNSDSAGSKQARELADPANPVHQAFIAFAKNFEAAVNAQDSAGMSAAIDWKRICDKSEEGLKLSAPLKKGFEEGARGSVEKVLIAEFAGGGQYKLLRTTVRNGRARAIFRLISAQGLNYHDALLSRDAQGKVRIVDIYLYITGQSLTSQLRWNLMQATADDDSGFSFTRRQNSYENHFPLLLKMKKTNEAGNAKEALEIYRQLPEVLQHSVAVLILRAMAAENVGEAEYQSAYDDFCKYHPNNAAIDMFSIDYHFNQNHFAEARLALDRLNKRTGGDPYLDFLIANSFFAEGNLDEAARLAQRAIDEEPSLAKAHWIRITVALQQQDFAAVRTGLLDVERRGAVAVGDLKGVALYADFVKSPEYDRWIAERTASGEPQSPAPVGSADSADLRLETRGLSKSLDAAPVEGADSAPSAASDGN